MHSESLLATLMFFDSSPTLVSLSLIQSLMSSSPSPNALNQSPIASSAPDFAPTLKPSPSPWGKILEGRSSPKKDSIFSELSFHFRNMMMQGDLGILSKIKQSREIVKAKEFPSSGAA